MICGIIQVNEGCKNRGAICTQLKISKAAQEVCTATFRDENNRIVGAALFDTSFEDKWYLPHIDDDALLDDGEPEKMSGNAEKRLVDPQYIKVFAVTDSGYAAHCGVWYDGGDTAYIEPVATVPEHRRKGLGKAVVYEAARRAKERGAKRAIVLSDNEFYFRIGMKVSSELGTWKKTNEVNCDVS